MPKEIRTPNAETVAPAWGRRRCPAALLALFIAVSAFGAPFVGTPPGQLLAAGNNRVMLLSTAGEVLWQYPAKLTHDVWMLPSGNVLFADGETVTEVTRAKKVVFQYRAAEQKGGGTYACQRLANGNTMIGENSTGRVLEVDPDGKVVFTLSTTPSKVGEHHNLRMVRKLGNGNYLVCHSGARLVKEYTPKGEVVLEIKVPGKVAFAAIRTAKNTTLVSSLDQITDFDSKGEKLWECTTRDLEGATIRNLTGMHLMPDGSLVVGCYQAYDKGEGNGLFMVSREKKILWRYSNPAADGTMMAVQLLTPDGKAAPWPCLR
jgi:hypothetical protein